MHTKPMEDSQGLFDNWKHSKERKCFACGKINVSYRIWKSDCGAYEDFQYKCEECGHIWWIDGPDF